MQLLRQGIWGCSLHCKYSSLCVWLCNYWSAWSKSDNLLKLPTLDECVCCFTEWLTQCKVYIIKNHIDQWNELNLSVLNCKTSFFLQLLSGLSPHAWSQTNWCGICVGQSGAWTGFSLSSAVSPVSAAYLFAHLSPLLYDLSNWRH